MKKFIKTIKKIIKVVDESNREVARYQALNPMSYYMINHPMWY